MKVLYSIGADNGDDHLALRFSLRSIEKFAAGCEQVIVVGCPPSWLTTEVVSLPIPPDPRRYKQQNILDAVLAAIDAGLVKGEFLYSSDDHFLVSPVDFDRFPYYYKSKELPTFDSVVSASGLRGWAVADPDQGSATGSPVSRLELERSREHAHERSRCCCGTIIGR